MVLDETTRTEFVVLVAIMAPVGRVIMYAARFAVWAEDLSETAITTLHETVLPIQEAAHAVGSGVRGLMPWNFDPDSLPGYSFVHLTTIEKPWLPTLWFPLYWL